ncbi:MAG: DEAD/DEAH box helicase family protein, partial [Methanobrevibacter sp.]|nr:DEAD/DEAH box helicase family protein [Methanobrevibacter sp.]
MQYEKIQKYAIDLFGSSFEFREGQLEAINSIIENVVSNIKQTVLEAPTGSGKSIIALLAAYVLYREYGKKSYVLVSDLSLFDQYVNDIKNLEDVECFGYIKGKENYTCYVNGCKVSQSKCSLQGLSITATAYAGWKRGLGCAYHCKYVQEYRKATQAPITLMTYQLYFIQRNYVEDLIYNGKNPHFPKRDLVICDECHKICDICQSHFAPRISIDRPYWMKVLDKYCHSGLDERERINIIGKIELSADNDELLDAVNEYGQYLEHYCRINIEIRSRLSKSKYLMKHDKEALAAGNQARQEHCKIADMVSFVKELKSSEYIVKTTLGNDITINFVFDNLMLKKYFHEKSDCELLMSATVGDFNEYASLAGLDENTFKTLSMKSTFDFSNSPIYVSDDNRMSAGLKHQSIKTISRQVVEICRSYAGMRGIIQTGSYMNSEELKRSLPKDVSKRCIFYSNNTEKKLALDTYMSTTETILIGPTLIEGL